MDNYNNYNCNVFYNISGCEIYIKTIIKISLILNLCFLILNILCIAFRYYKKKWKLLNKNKKINYYEFLLIICLFLNVMRIIYLYILFNNFYTNIYLQIIDELWWIMTLFGTNISIKIIKDILLNINIKLISDHKIYKHIINIQIFIYFIINIILVIIMNIYYKYDIEKDYVFFFIRKIFLGFILIYISLILYIYTKKLYTQIYVNINKNQSLMIINNIMLMYKVAFFILLLFGNYLIIQSIIVFYDYKKFINKYNIIIFLILYDYILISLLMLYIFIVIIINTNTP